MLGSVSEGKIPFWVLRPLNKRCLCRSMYSGVICLSRELWPLPVPGKFIHCFTSFKGERQAEWILGGKYVYFFYCGVFFGQVLWVCNIFSLITEPSDLQAKVNPVGYGKSLKNPKNKTKKQRLARLLGLYLKTIGRAIETLLQLNIMDLSFTSENSLYCSFFGYHSCQREWHWD